MFIKNAYSLDQIKSLKKKIDDIADHLGSDSEVFNDETMKYFYDNGVTDNDIEVIVGLTEDTIYSKQDSYRTTLDHINALKNPKDELYNKDLSQCLTKSKALNKYYTSVLVITDDSDEFRRITRAAILKKFGQDVEVRFSDFVNSSVDKGIVADENWDYLVIDASIPAIHYVSTHIVHFNDPVYYFDATTGEFYKW